MNTFSFSSRLLFFMLAVLFCIPDARANSLDATIEPESPPPSVINGHEWIDLGLSVKWATCNVGASTPSEYGDYFAWGETFTRDDFSNADYRFLISGDCWENYRCSKYIASAAPLLSQHLSVDSRGTVDDMTVLELSDDAASANWEGSWRMPTVEEWWELRLYCTWTWTSIGKTKGYKVVSRMNGNSIFLPAAGFPSGSDSSLRYVNVVGYYWSSSLCLIDSMNAWQINFSQSGINITDIGRYCWRSIRPVTE